MPGGRIPPSAKLTCTSPAMCAAIGYRAMALTLGSWKAPKSFPQASVRVCRHSNSEAPARHQ